MQTMTGFWGWGVHGECFPSVSCDTVWEITESLHQVQLWWNCSCNTSYSSRSSVVWSQVFSFYQQGGGLTHQSSLFWLSFGRMAAAVTHKKKKKELQIVNILNPSFSLVFFFLSWNNCWPRDPESSMNRVYLSASQITTSISKKKKKKRNPCKDSAVWAPR